jgi:hypothetical protein
MRRALIFKNRGWEKLTGKNVINSIVEIKGCRDVRYEETGPVFPNAKIVFMNKCDDNMVWYWLHKDTFPSVKKIYLGSHPSDRDVFRRFPKNTTIYLSSAFGEYKQRWANNLKNVRFLDQSRMEVIFSKMEEETIKTTLRE